MLRSLKFFRGGFFQTDKPYSHIKRVIDSTEIILVTDGILHMEIGGERISAEEGEALLILPGEPHGGFKESNGAAFIWLHFDGAESGMLPPRRTRPKSWERVILLAKEVLHYERTDGYPEGITECILRALLAELCYKGEEDGSLIAAIKEIVRKNRMRSQGAAELAQSLGYNADYLNRYFKSRLGVGLKEYIDSVRIGCIKQELLIGGGSLAEIGKRCGFSDYKYFLKYFKYHAGMSPKEYRETYYNAHTN